MKSLMLLSALLICAASKAQAPQTPAAQGQTLDGGSNLNSSIAADMPATLQVPAGEHLILRAHATGWQIYSCGAGADGKATWTLKAPDADLHDDKGSIIGHHGVGPSWTHADGSQVLGKAVAHVDAADSNSIPWLLVTAVGHSGAGVFERVTTIQRLNTYGGRAPGADTCDPTHPVESRISYRADYYFYAPK